MQGEYYKSYRKYREIVCGETNPATRIPLTRRPRELTSRQNVKMNMKHRLLRPGPAVEYSTVIRVPEPVHELLCQQEQPPHQLRVLGCEIVQRRDLLLGNHEQMHRRLRADVVNRDVPIVLVRNLRRNLLRDDFGED